MSGLERNFHEELYNYYCLLNVTSMAKSGRMRWAVHAASMGKKRSVCKVLVGKPEE
jgi:hypothetical protein